MNALIKLAEEHGHWLIRLNLAAIFLYHGITKFPMAEMMSQGMGMPLFMIYLLATAEVIAGLGFLAGALLGSLYTRISGLLVAGIMASAIMMVHWPQWSFVANDTKPMGGMEFQLLVMILGLLFALRGNELFGKEGSSAG